MRSQIVWLVAVALGLRLAVAFSALPGPVMDETGYDDSGWALAQGQGYVMNGRLTYKAPLYSLFLAGVYRVAGHDYRAVRVVQAFGGVLLCLGVVWLGHLLFTDAVGWLAGWWMAVHPLGVALTGRLLSEGLYTGLLIMTLLGMTLLIRVPTGWKAVGVGMGCGGMALTRSMGIGFGFLFSLVLMAFKRWGVPFRRRMGYALLVLAGLVGVVTPWTLRNWIRVGSFVPISTEGGRTFYGGWIPFPGDKILGFNPVNETTLTAETIASEVERDRFYFLKALEHLKEHPLSIPRLTGWKMLFFWCPFDWEIMGHSGTYHGLLVALFPFALLGLAQAFRQNEPALWILLPPILLTFVVSVLFSGLPRFRLPIEPLLTLLASSGLIHFLKSQPKPGLGWSGWVAAWFVFNLAGVFYSPQMKWAFRTTAEFLRIW